MASDLEGTPPPVNEESQYLEYVILRVKYSARKSGISTSVYLDIGVSKDHSLHGSVEAIEDGAIKIGFGKNVAVLTNEVDALNYFSAKGWKIASVNEIKIMSTSYTQYLLSKEI